MGYLTFLKKNFVNFKGWSTNRKFIIIESDDWGSIRMASKEAVLDLNEKYNLAKNKFTLLDGLERTVDLKELFSLLTNFKDSRGNHPVITACSLVANPDFNRINEDGFSKYHYETIVETYKRYEELDLLQVWKNDGIDNRLLYPQFHGREHINPLKWLNVLQSGNRLELDAFKNKCLLGLSGSLTALSNQYMAAFEARSEEECVTVKNTVVDGVNLFKEIFGFQPISFAAPQSKQFEDLNSTLVHSGLLFCQTGQYFVPDKVGGFKKKNKFWGDQDVYGMTFWRRNCNFEPYRESKTEIETCLNEIKTAFRWGKPAVISSHRINFTSRIDQEHRNRCLSKLETLLSEILRRFPEVEFINSEELALFMQQSNKPLQ